MAVLLGLSTYPKIGSIKDSSYKLYFTTASTLITISTQARVGTPLIFAVVFTHYNTKIVTAITNIRASDRSTKRGGRRYYRS